MLVVHEVFGVHEHIKDICRRLAKLGYYAIAPELFAREGELGGEGHAEADVRTSSPRRRTPKLSPISTRRWNSPKPRGAADISRAAVTGFCWGGRKVWLYAAHNPKLKAGVAWYGPLARPHDARLRRRTRRTSSAS